MSSIYGDNIFESNINKLYNLVIESNRLFEDFSTEIITESAIGDIIHKIIDKIHKFIQWFKQKVTNIWNTIIKKIKTISIKNEIKKADKKYAKALNEYMQTESTIYEINVDELMNCEPQFESTVSKYIDKEYIGISINTSKAAHLYKLVYIKQSTKGDFCDSLDNTLTKINSCIAIFNKDLSKLQLEEDAFRKILIKFTKGNYDIANELNKLHSITSEYIKERIEKDKAEDVLKSVKYFLDINSKRIDNNILKINILSDTLLKIDNERKKILSGIETIKKHSGYPDNES